MTEERTLVGHTEANVNRGESSSYLCTESYLASDWSCRQISIWSKWSEQSHS